MQNINAKYKQFNDDIKVFEFGLGEKDEKVKISGDEDSSSIYSKNANKILVEIKEAEHFLTKKNIDRIDLMKINIEGGEYKLLDHLIKRGSFFGKIGH